MAKQLGRADTGLLKPLSVVGYQALERVAEENPDVFIKGKKQDVEKTALEKLAVLSPDDQRFDPDRGGYHIHTGSLKKIKSRKGGGPVGDPQNARYLRAALAGWIRAQGADEYLLASLVCFHLYGFAKQRWQSSKLFWSKKRADRSRCVKKHWLGRNKQDHTVARLWWLYEFSHGAATFSRHDADMILNTLAGHVNFYHQLLRRHYLMASDRIRGFVFDMAWDAGVVNNNNTTQTSKIMRQINLAGGYRSLDALPDDALKRVVEDAISEVVHPK